MVEIYVYVSCQNPSQVGNDKTNEKKQRGNRDMPTYVIWSGMEKK